MSGKKKILLFSDWYEPGYRAGGPIRSCVNFVQQMKDAYIIHVFTSDRDLGGTAAYENIQTNQWIEKDENVNIYYCSPGELNWKNIRKQFLTVSPDFVYVNSMFSKYFSIYPLLMYKRYHVKAKIILAPRGMLRRSALQFKSFKKNIFLSLFRSLGFQKKIYFQAADDTEYNDIALCFGKAANISLVPNFPAGFSNFPGSTKKKVNELFILFVGRIHPIKNLDFLLRVLESINAIVKLTIVGSMEDRTYWQSCETLIAKLPSNITVMHKGELPNAELPGILSKHHILALPTKGENFGHAIFESLSSGRPALISDQTPWIHLKEKKAGWDLPLDQPVLFTDAIREVAGFDQQEYDAWCYSAWKFAHDYVQQLDLRKEYLKLFS
ncbi:MAG: glycosyltransferase [Bacteroidetes bacterium]|nr:glycosyltransferase [Bacteroidota bacterium]